LENENNVMEDGEKMVNVFAYTTRYLTRKENIENATLNNLFLHQCY